MATFLLKSKKGELGREFLVKLIIFCIFFFALIIVVSVIWNTLTVNDYEKSIEEHLLQFKNQVEEIIDDHKTVSFGEVSILMPVRKKINPPDSNYEYYLIAHSNGEVVEAESKSFVPSTNCKHGTSSCLCIHLVQSNILTNTGPEVIKCYNIPVNAVYFHGVTNDDLDFPNSKSPLLERKKYFNKKTFIGEKIDFKVDLMSSQLEHYLGLHDSKATSNTKYLGFEPNPKTNHALKQFVVKTAYKSKLIWGKYLTRDRYLNFYVEHVNVGNYNFLFIFPYSRGLLNRKYFLKTYPGEGKCDNEYMNTAFPATSGYKYTRAMPLLYNYCYNKHSYLVLAKDSDGLLTFEECPDGRITEGCVCANRVVFSGACFNGKLISYPYDFCSGLGTNSDCGVYQEEISCVLDYCELDDQGCKWSSNCKSR